MKLLKLPVKIILAPIVLAMTGIVFVLALMMAVSTRLLAIASSLLGTFALLVFVASHLMHGVVDRVEIMCICSACGCPYTLTFCCQLRDIIRDIILICHARHPPNDIIAT